MKDEGEAICFLIHESHYVSPISIIVRTSKSTNILLFIFISFKVQLSGQEHVIANPKSHVGMDIIVSGFLIHEMATIIIDLKDRFFGTVGIERSLCFKIGIEPSGPPRNKRLSMVFQ